MGARDLSNIMTPPTNRIPITTEVQVFDNANIKEIILCSENKPDIEEINPDYLKAQVKRAELYLLLEKY